ncbi:DNA polymerase-3 subunit gamma/tau [Brevibacterium iodinum ATCC 49514]|uniref:DNA-directed DNA polymerase n=1 Tax=Brevibacterium iodinum ATCC 49514 TaxID=1255616 RepID=A0A2H1KDJ1_9MICO|nr:DNA polymerase III subunit gamma and tau [Brevibacterium iodinum]SMX97800.1 DNA polymerase-3 subunit gamma/tau [Brevibacterium iodinum ATCC 49514]SUW11428.1 DNA polymerase III subunit tau [Brevibacterium iodinum]
MSTALYRRYRPETFDEVIGQEHVTDPLKAAIERGRINHAYLFSGPRGCGKTTSARILARCLNCEQGPTPVPCGECPSCRDLANGGPGSLDVVEIDAASHNGVDDARDLRERAVYAPARDRYKVFILDEAHMVTSQGFNALLKIVEEPPPHIKFIFATTEPEKVIGTIRSRTHHYPFRLVPPEALGNYLEELCARESVQVAKGVLPLVVRAGGGSVRDTLSVLDQLIAGAGPDGVDYGRAVALLGYTPDSLLSDIVDAFSAGDGAGVYRAVERVIESGQDPRRFVEDLLERFRDLIVINAAPEAAHAFLPEVPPDRLERLTLQANGFGQGELSRAADLLNVGLTEMSGATSPRLQLELICARILLPGSGRSRDAVLSRMERMERRIGMSATGVAANVPPQAVPDQGAAQAPVQGQGAPAGRAGQGRAPAADQGQSGGRPPAGDASPGAPGRGAGAPDANASAGQTQSAAHDDFDDIAAMAAAAESMLNEPAAQPGQRPEQGQQRQSDRQGSQGQAELRDQSDQQAQSSQHDGKTEPEQAPQSGPQSQTAHAGPQQKSAENPRNAERGRPAQEQQPSPDSSPEPSAEASGAPKNESQSVQNNQQRQDSVGASAHSSAPDSTPANQPQRQSAPASAAPAGPGDGSRQSEQAAAPEATSVAGTGDIGGEIEAIRRAWPSILASVEKRSRLTRAIIAANAIPQSFSDGVVYLGFNNAGSVQGFQQRDHAAKLAAAINDVLGIQARIDVGDVGRIGGGTAGGGSQGKGSSAPPMNDSGGNHGPAPSQRRPSSQEVAAVVGTREVDKPQVDHEKFWEPSGPTQGPWSSDDEEGEQPGPPTEPTTESSPINSADERSAGAEQPDSEAADGYRQQDDVDPAGETETPTGSEDDSSAAETPDSGSSADFSGASVSEPNSSVPDVPDVVVPDLSDDDFFGSPADTNTSPTGDFGQPDRSHQQESASVTSSGFGDDSPMEYVEPRWEAPNWNDGPSPIDPSPIDEASSVTASTDVDETSAGSGAVDVGAVVVPPPDDDLDYPDLGDTSSDFGGGAFDQFAPAVKSPPPTHGEEAKPFKSRFAALAEKHGATTPPAGPGYGSDPQANPAGGTAPRAASATGSNPYPQGSGSDEDDYDPETDLDVSEAPQMGVDVIARVLGGEIIDEREV